MENQNTEVETETLTTVNFNKTETKQNSKIDQQTSNRYSNAELLEFKKLIFDKYEKAKADYDLLKEAISYNGNNGTNDTSPDFKPGEDVTEAASKEEAGYQLLRLQKYIEHLKNALVRIENKSYGICYVTGKLISKERLKSVPHTTVSMNAKLKMQKTK